VHISNIESNVNKFPSYNFSTLTPKNKMSTESLSIMKELDQLIDLDESQKELNTFM
jgi:hypothetical protein